MTPTPEQVVAAVGSLPVSIGALGLQVVRDAAGAVDAGPVDESAPVGQRLARAGLSLSALQRLVDALVAEGRLVEVRGKDLWDRGLPTAGTKAMGRYYLAAVPAGSGP